MSAAAIGAAYFAADFLLDRFVIKSDSADPEGFIVQAQGFGLDDVVRIAAIGAAGATAIGLVKTWSK